MVFPGFCDGPQSSENYVEREHRCDQLKRHNLLKKQEEGERKRTANESKDNMKSANEKVKLGTNYAIKKAVVVGYKTNDISDKANRKATRFAEAADMFGIKPTGLYGGDFNMISSFDFDINLSPLSPQDMPEQR
jgi:hypothetical protein